MSEIAPLSPSAIAVLEQLFKKGPTWDGNIVSKPGRGDRGRALPEHMTAAIEGGGAA